MVILCIEFLGVIENFSHVFTAPERTAVALEATYFERDDLCMVAVNMSTRFPSLNEGMLVKEYHES